MARGSVSQVRRKGRSIHKAGGGDVETQAAMVFSSQPSTCWIACIAGPWKSTRL